MCKRLVGSLTSPPLGTGEKARARGREAGAVATYDHNAELRNAARRILRPLGLAQKGRSRTWLDDHGWWLLVVEFQPSGFAGGSYLNVGPMHLWAERDFLAFENDPRVTWGRGTEFVDARRDGAPAFESLVERAATRVLEMRTEHGEGLPALRRLAKSTSGRPFEKDAWGLLNAGVAAGLVGDVALAESRFFRILRAAKSSAPGWQQALATDVATRWKPALSHPDLFREEAAESVRRCRELLKLPQLASIAFD